MLFKDVIYLITTTESENAIGDTVETDIPRQVFANEKGIRQSEFYQAHATGLKPELMFEVRKDDYFGEAKLKYNNKTYNIFRTYPTKNEMLELVCQGMVNKHASS